MDATWPLASLLRNCTRFTVALLGALILTFSIGEARAGVVYTWNIGSVWGLIEAPDGYVLGTSASSFDTPALDAPIVTFLSGNTPSVFPGKVMSLAPNWSLHLAVDPTTESSSWGWDTGGGSLAFVTTGPGSVIAFDGEDPITGGSAVFARFEAVPEPNSIALAGLGFVVLCFARRCRRVGSRSIAVAR